MKKPFLCCSYPKCGRTWLRFVLANYFNQVNNLVDSVNYNNVFSLFPNSGNNLSRGVPAYQYMNNKRLPLILFDHTLYRTEFNSVDVIFLVRGVLDTLVSNYFQATNRLGMYKGDIQAYIRDPEQGLDNLINYYNNWGKGLGNTKHCVIRYEDMHEDIYACIKKLFMLLGITLDKVALSVAVELSTFSNMKSIELKEGFANQKQEIKTGDNNAMRAREGKVGGYKKYFSDQDIAYINERCEQFFSPAAKILLKSD